MEGRTDEQELDRLVSRTLSIPCRPAALVRLQEVIDSPTGGVGQAVRILEEDPGLAARCLRLVNSAAYGLRRRCATLGHAATMLGLRALRDIALQKHLESTYQHLAELRGFDLERFWRHAVVTGTAARELARHASALRDLEPDSAVVCGLLHNVGRLVMLDAGRDDYLAVVNLAGGRGEPARHAEETTFGFDHGTVGALLVARWGLSTDVVLAAKKHHAPPTTTVPPASAVAIASEVAHHIVDGSLDEAQERLLADDIRAFGLSEPAAQRVLETAVESAEAFAGT